jgi:hypothetical protein
MGFSDYLCEKLLDYAFSSTLYAGLATTAGDPDGSAVSEPWANGYARVQCVASTWAAATANAKTNADAVQFPEATGAWGTISSIVFYGTATAGDYFGAYALATAVAVVSDQIVKFAAGDIDVTLS